MMNKKKKKTQGGYFSKFSVQKRSTCNFFFLFVWIHWFSCKLSNVKQVSIIHSHKKVCACGYAFWMCFSNVVFSFLLFVWEFNIYLHPKYGIPQIVAYPVVVIYHSSMWYLSIYKIRRSHRYAIDYCKVYLCV